MKVLPLVSKKINNDLKANHPSLRRIVEYGDGGGEQA
jgi:hypothetical protein